MRPDEADSQLAFASPPWPDLPRHRRDRLSHPHPPDPAPTTRTVPDPAPVRAGGQYGAEGYQADSPVPKIPAQAGIHLLLLPHAQEETSGDGPLPPQGLRGSVFLSHKHRFPGACRGLLQKLRGASRARLRHAPERRGEETVFPHAGGKAYLSPTNTRFPGMRRRDGERKPSFLTRHPRRAASGDPSLKDAPGTSCAVKGLRACNAPRSYGVVP